MNKEQIKERLCEIRAEMEVLEGQLKEPEKWEPKGGNWRVIIDEDGVQLDCDRCVIDTELPFRCKTLKQADQMGRHIKNQALLQQLANEHNGDWAPDWGDNSNMNCFVFFDHDEGEWNFSYANILDNTGPAFSEDAAKKALKILNNMETGIEL
jgi:hypothetical protein